MEAKIFQPSAEPSSFSLDLSGCGIMPRTFRFSFRIPAILASDPLGLASARDLASRGCISKRDAILRLQAVQIFRRAEVVSFHVADGNLQHIPLG